MAICSFWYGGKNRKHSSFQTITSKKKADFTWNHLLYILLGIVVLVILFVLYNSWFSGAKQGGDTIVSSVDLTKSDCDNDNIIDFVDPCICDDNSVCKSGSKEEIESCKQSTLSKCKQ
ncbi:MAG: hypothetical protein QW594_02500 [Candidatus Woesearchaeota archaeon]